MIVKAVTKAKVTYLSFALRKLIESKKTEERRDEGEFDEGAAAWWWWSLV